ncbi:MAG TPA: ABC transporter permease [Tenuifilaceae bacterium]|nr:ABC transporter permease [Tenuifilaceae bacterium]
MNSLKLAYRRLFRKGEHTVTRITSLSLGLAFGILLLSEVLYYYSFDSFYSDAGNIYVVNENYRPDKSSKEIKTNPRVSGAIAPGLKEEVPGIEAATRLNSIGSSIFYTEDLKSYKGDFSLADEYLFDVLPRPMISGNPGEILKTPMNCMVSDKIANAMGGNVIGKVIELKNFPGKKLTIAGVFKALPENTNYRYDVLISMISTGQFTWDGTNNWLGNDRYYACVKLLPGVLPESLTPAVRKMQEKHQDIVKLEQMQPGLVLKYSFKPIRRIYAESIKNIILILTLIAFAVLFVSLMNYILLTLSALVSRAKTSAIYKCNGAQAKNLQWLIISETVLLFLISLAVAFLIIVVLKPFAEEQVGHNLASALNPYVVWPLIALMVLLVGIIGYLPGRYFARIPVATAFRNYRQKGNRWKLALLFFQFIGASFIFTLMVIVTLQYNKMKNADHGYRTEGVYYGYTNGMDGHKVSTILHELRAMPEIEGVGMGTCLPTEGPSGNNVYSPDGEKELFNIADLYYIDENYLSILNIPVIEGQSFSAETSVANDLLISKKCADKLVLFNGWSDGVIGKQVTITEHDQSISIVKGVYPDFIINSITNPDPRPSVFFYLPEEQFEQLKDQYSSYPFIILVKVHGGVGSNIMKKIADVFNEVLPYKDAVVESLAAQQQHNYKSERGFRNAMMAGNIIILLITGIGLLGYTTSEVTRRRKELAIRKINGASLGNLLKIFVLDLEYIATPAVTIGLIAAWLVGSKWMQGFAYKIPLHWWIFALSGTLILLAVAVVAVVNYIRIANRNPVESLRYE